MGNSLKYILFERYLIYSTFYFLDLYLKEKKKLKLKEKKLENRIIYSVSRLHDIKKSICFYYYVIYRSFKFTGISTFFEPKLPLYLFSSDRTNFVSLNDHKFSKLLNRLRRFRCRIKSKGTGYSFLNEMVKRAIPLSKVIYQRRGRIFIPLTTFFYNSKVRRSLGIKEIYNQSFKVKNLPKSKKNLFDYKLFITIVKIYFANNESFIYQSEIDENIRRDSYKKGYFLKTLKAHNRDVL